MSLAYLLHGRVAFNPSGTEPVEDETVARVTVEELKAKIDGEFRQIIYLVQNDTRPYLEFSLMTIKYAHSNNTLLEEAVNLTSAVVNFKLRKKGSKRIVNTGHTACSIYSAPTNGICRYYWVSGDLAACGPYEAELELVDSGTQTMFPIMNLIVRGEF